MKLVLAYSLILMAVSLPRVAAQSFWQRTNGPSQGIVQALVVNASGDVFAGTQGGGVFRSTDQGTNWTGVNAGLTNLDVRSLAINPRGDLFAATGGGVFRSADNGARWTVVNSGIKDLNVLSVATYSGGIVFIGTQNGEIDRSTDHGGSWTTVKLSLPFSLTPPILSLAIESRGYIFAGPGTSALGGGVLRSTDNGTSWRQNGPNNVRSLAIKCGVGIFAGTQDKGVFLTSDGGSHWASINAGLTNLNVQSLAINASGDIFAGTKGGGVFRSTDNGTNWTAINAGLTNSQVSALAFDSADFILAGTSGVGVFRSLQPTLEPKPCDTLLGILQSHLATFSGNLSIQTPVILESHCVTAQTEAPTIAQMWVDNIQVYDGHAFQAITGTQDQKQPYIDYLLLPQLKNGSVWARVAWSPSVQTIAVVGPTSTVGNTCDIIEPVSGSYLRHRPASSTGRASGSKEALLAPLACEEHDFDYGWFDDFFGTAGGYGVMMGVVTCNQSTHMPTDCSPERVDVTVWIQNRYNTADYVKGARAVGQTCNGSALIFVNFFWTLGNPRDVFFANVNVCCP